MLGYLAIKMPQRTQQLRTELDFLQIETNAPIPNLANPECILDEAGGTD